MNRPKYLVIMFFTIIEMIFVSLTLSDDDERAIPYTSNNEPTCKGDYSTILVYSQEGALSYRLTTQHVEYFSEKGISLLTYPILTTYNIDTTPAWSVCSLRATLTNDHILYLNGHVEIKSLPVNIQAIEITTDNAKVDLITQDVVSQDFVTLRGRMFKSTGLGIQGNLRTQNARLIKKVKTFYEIQKRQV